MSRESAPLELQLELIDLLCDPVLKEKFNSLKLSTEYYAALSKARFTSFQTFGGWHRGRWCEQTFSMMDINKAHLRSHLADVPA